MPFFAGPTPRGAPRSDRSGVGDAVRRAGPWALLLLVVAPVLLLAVHQLSTLRDSAKTGGDKALIELSTMRAASGRQLLGPYSRFGFHHPGPLMFYCLAPFWAGLGRSHAAQATGALAVNLVALIGIALALRRVYGDGRWPAALAALGLFLLWLQSGFLVSVWNPDLAVLPLGLALAAFSAAAAGRLAWLPAAVVAGSFAAQSHVACGVPVALAGALAAAATVGRVRRSRTSPGAPLRWRSHVALAGALGALVWLPTLVEQQLGRPGNVTLTLRSLAERRDGQSWGVALKALAVQACGFLGAPLGTEARADASPRAALALGAAAAVLVALLLLAATRARERDPVASSLCLGCVVLWAAAAAGAHAIPGSLHPYLVRWASVVGVSSAIAAAAAFLGPSAGTPRAGSWRLGVCGALVLTTAGLGVRSVVRFPATGAAAWEARTDRLSDATVAALAARGVRRPHVKILGGHAWDPAAAIVLQCTKAGLEPTVDDGWLFMFGEPNRFREADDGVVLVAQGSAAADLAALRGVEPVATAGDTSVFRTAVERPLAGELRLGEPESEVYVRNGFWSAEAGPGGTFRWSRGAESSLALPAAAGPPHRLLVTASPFEVPGERQRLTVELNGTALSTAAMAPGWTTLPIEVPAGLVRSRNLLTFRYSVVRSPHQLTGADDRRELAVAFRAVALLPVAAP